MNIVTQLQSTGNEMKVDCRSEMYVTNYFVFIVILDKDGLYWKKLLAMKSNCVVAVHEMLPI